jgi:phosphoglycerate dehydrogenase-like enzyme
LLVSKIESLGSLDVCFEQKPTQIVVIQMQTPETSKKTVVVDPRFRRMDEIFAPEDLARLHDMAHVVWAKDEAMPLEEFDKVREEVFAVVTARWRYGPIESLPNLKAILEVSGGPPSPSTLDYAACFARSIRVLSCAPAFGPMVAEMALCMALASARGIVDAHNDFVEGTEKYLHAANQDAFTLFDQPVGFIGFGGLARSLRPLLQPFRCPIQVYDPWLPDTYLRNQGVTPVALDELLANSRVIFVLAIPARDNKALISRERLALIRPNAVFVLISRSHLVDFDALTEMLLEGRFRAAIDVFPQEPLAPDHPIRRAPGVILSGHRAGSVPKDLQNIGRLVVNDIEAMLHGLPHTDMQVAQPELVYRLP